MNDMMDDTCSDRPTKRSRIEDDKNLNKNGAKPAPAPAPAPSRSVNVNSNANGNGNVDAGSFLFRSPASPDEINEIANKMRSIIDTAHKEISEIGYEAYRKKISIASSSSSTSNAASSSSNTNNSDTTSDNMKGGKSSEGSDFSGDGDGDDDFDDDDDNDGIDTEDEIDHDRIIKEKSLEEAVVRGNPRRYQTALVELAKKQNTIVNLGTGQGKTLIALLLIRHFAPAYREGTAGRTKQTLFLVPSVALAQQHTTTLEANLPYTVATACHNSTKTVGSRERMAEANILVATHGGARDLLMHYGDMFSFDRINLLIMDECHYASGDHGFATIMKNFYHRLPINQRPRVLGLTASPLVTVKSDVDDEKLGSMLRDLEDRMDSKIACLSRIGVGDLEGKESSSSSSSSPSSSPTPTPSADHDMGYITREAEERCVHYHKSMALPKLPEYDNIGIHEGRAKEFNQLLELYSDLGPQLTSIYAATVAREISRNRYEMETAEQFAVAVQYLKDVSEFCKKQCIGCPDGGKTEKIALLEQLLEDIIESKGSRSTVGVVFVDRRITALALYDYFRTRSKRIAEGNWVRVSDTRFNRKPQESDKNLLFAPEQNRKRNKRFDLRSRQFEDMNLTPEELDNAIIGDIINDALPDSIDMESLIDLEPSPLTHLDNPSKDEEVSEKQHRTLKCDMIVRQCTQVFKYLDKSHHFCDTKKASDWLHEVKKVKDVLDAMRQKRTNVLIATSVVEEGVDVESCSFVIAFDSIKTTKSYVQMKGRARQTNAKFFVFQDTSSAASLSPYMHLHTAQNTDLRVRQYIESRPEYTPVPSDPIINFDPYTGDLNAELVSVARGEYRTGSGFVDLSSAKTLLNRYTLSIPLDASFRSTRDSYGIHLPQFEENRLILPSHIPSSARCIFLPKAFREKGKKEKQSILSLIACVRLHKLNLLNDRLLPLKRKDMQNKLLGVALTELFTSGKTPPQKCPPMPSTKNVVYIYKLCQTGRLFDQNDEVLGGAGRSLCLVTLVPLALGSTSMHFEHIEIGDISVDIKDPCLKQLNGDEWDYCTKFHTVVMNARWRKRTSSSFYVYNPEKVKEGILPPYVVSCLTKEGDIDWARIEKTISDYGRSDEERIHAVRQSAQKDDDLPTPRIWSPVYDPLVSYISYGPSTLRCDAQFPQKTDDVSTYSEYFTKRREYKVEDSCRLFAVQRLWYLPRKMEKSVNKSMFDVWKKRLRTDLDLPDMDLQDGERSPCEGLIAALMPADACLEAPIADAALFLHCLILPQILYHMDRIMTAQLFVEHCVEHLPILGSHIQSISHQSLDDVLEALTAKSCIMQKNYDRLEWLGDAVLKLIHTDALLNSRDLRKWVSYLHEGELSFLRSAMGSNKRLLHASKGAGFDRFILFRQLGRGQYVPIGMELREIQEDGTERLAEVENVEPGKKTSADVIESLLGLIYFKVNFKAAYDVATELGVTLPRDPDYDASIPGYVSNSDLQEVADTFLGGIKFEHPELLEESVTHPSCIHEKVSCYQRLEWVGDAVLCLFARDWIFNKFPQLQVGELVILESTIVCNETLAYLAVNAKLAKHLNHRDPSLPNKISKFEIECNQRGLWATDPPKPLSDIVEAMFGAVFVDQGLEVAQKAVKFAMKPVVHALTNALEKRDSADIQSRARAMVHPKQYVHELAGGVLSVKSWREEVFAIKKRHCPVWKAGIWGKASRDGSNSIGLIESCGIDLIGIEEQSSHVARNLSCAVAMEIFENNPDLIEKLKSFTQLLRNGNGQDAQAS